MSCVTCHQLHQLATDPRPADEWANDQLKHGLESGNAACVQCHSEYVDAERLAKHSHHAANSSGSHCYNCHMPHTTYGLLKAIRSHQIDSLDVATTLATGRPNACNQCHLDKTLKWTAEALAEWYGHSQPVLSEDQQTIAASILWLLRGDAGQRALTAWTYGWKEAQLASGTAWMPLILVPLLNDPYDAVRYIAAQSLRKLDGYEEIPYDFLGSPADSERALQYVLERWQQREPLSVSSNRELLLDSDGDVILSQIQRLLQQRDDRKIYLAE